MLPSINLSELRKQLNSFNWLSNLADWWVKKERERNENQSTWAAVHQWSWWMERIGWFEWSGAPSSAHRCAASPSTLSSFCSPAARGKKEEKSWMVEGCGLLCWFAGLWAAAPLAAAEFHSMNSIKFIPFHPSRPFLSCCFRFLYECSPLLMSKGMKGIERLIGIAGLAAKPITNHSVIWRNEISSMKEAVSNQSINLHSFHSTKIKDNFYF